MRIAVLIASFASFGFAAVAQAGSQATCLPGDQAAILVSFERTGGLAGIHEKVVVRRSGRATYTRMRAAPVAFRISCARLRALRTALVNARFASLAPVYAPEDEVSDGFIESVAYAGRTVRVLTNAKPPLRLEHVLTVLRALASTRQ